MLAKLRAHVLSNIVGYLALFVASSGTAWAAARIGSEQIVDNSVRSVDLRNNGAVRSADVVDDSATNGGLKAADIASDAVGFGEIAASAFNADIAEQGNAFGIPNDGIQGFEVQDGTLGGADIDESTLNGVVKAQAMGGGCCRIRGGILYTDTPYNELDPNTSIDLGAFELRSTATGDPDKIRLCNPPGGVNFGASYTLYTGGAAASTGDTRSRAPFPTQDTCHTLDVNGADSGGAGDFRMWILERAWELMYVQGAAVGSNSGFTIFGLSLH